MPLNLSFRDGAAGLIFEGVGDVSTEGDFTGWGVVAPVLECVSGAVVFFSSASLGDAFDLLRTSSCVGAELVRELLTAE